MKNNKVLFIIAAMLNVFVVTTVLPGQAAHNDDTVYFQYILLVDSNSSNVPLIISAPECVIGVRFDMHFYIKRVIICMPMWTLDTVENSVIFRLYKWNGTYDATVNGEPIAEIARNNIQNQEYAVFEVEDDIAPPGTYLWTLSDAVNKTPGANVGVFVSNSPNDVIERNTVFFFNGYETNSYFYKFVTIEGYMYPR